MNKIKFNFYGFEVVVSSKSLEIIELLKKNFGYFYNYEAEVLKTFTLEVIIKEDLRLIVPKNLIAHKQSVNSMTYDEGDLRYNDYYSEAISVLDYKRETARIYGSDLNKIHEVAYLLILSRQGKWSDLNGFHKVHAMGVAKNNKNLIVMMPMKGGKTTLFTKFLNDPEYKLISDDTPLINSQGRVLPFPIRFGVEDNSSYSNLLNSIDDNYKFSLNREQFGKKILVDTLFYKDRIGSCGNKNILVQGIRWNSTECKIISISKYEMFKYLKTHLIVGVGLPMVVEYFLRGTVKDHMKNIKILLNRTITAIRLVKSSEPYIVYMGTDVENNVQEVKKLFN